jgi:RNA-directed DNA polymerase
VQKERAGTWEVQPHPPERSPAGAASKGQPELTASRLEVGPAHSTDEAVEGNDMVEGRGRPAGTTLTSAKGQTQRWQPLLPNLQRVNAAALASGRTRFTALLHHVDVAALERAFRRQRRAASPGVDRVTMDQYEHDLEGNLQRLHAMVHSGQYWPKPVLRTYIPKADGSKRPLGLPTLEDKIVQGAVAEVLNAIYEADFLGFSYGFRPARSAHKALTALDQALMTRDVNWVLDIDIRSFFDTVDHGWLMRMLAHRIADRRVLRLTERWLKAGILESGQWQSTEVGTPQGSGISPILANLFLHYVVDLWVHQWRQQQASGQIAIVRYADDMVIGCQSEDDARNLLAALTERLRQFGLAIHEGKTRLIAFGRRVARQRELGGERRPETFDFLERTVHGQEEDPGQAHGPQVEGATVGNEGTPTSPGARTASMALPSAQGSLRILRRHLQLSLHGAIPPPRCQIVVHGAAATKSEGETNLGMVRPAPGGLPPAKADCPPTLVRWTSMTAGYPSEEPIAGKPHDGICGGESQQWLSYPTFVQNRTLSGTGTVLGNDP